MGVGHAEAEGGQQPPVRQAVEGGQLLGHHARGCARAAPCTLVPNFSLVVRPAAKAMATTGSGASPPMRSDSQRLSKSQLLRGRRRPRRSARRSRAVRTPSPKPMRIFTAGCYAQVGRASAAEPRVGAEMRRSRRGAAAGEAAADGDRGDRGPGHQAAGPDPGEDVQAPRGPRSDQPTRRRPDDGEAPVPIEASASIPARTPGRPRLAPRAPFDTEASDRYTGTRSATELQPVVSPRALTRPTASAVPDPSIGAVTAPAVRGRPPYPRRHADRPRPARPVPPRRPRRHRHRRLLRAGRPLRPGAPQRRRHRRGRRAPGRSARRPGRGPARRRPSPPT